MKISRRIESFLWRRWIGGASVALAAACFIFAGTTLKAACADPTTWGPGGTHKPFVLSVPSGPLAPGPTNTSIVGMWHVTYSSPDVGGFFYEAFDQWHADGLEFENANLPPASGNMCMGVWQMAGHEVHLYHIGWSFYNSVDPYSYDGSFTLEETNTVSKDGQTYSGTFAYKAYDPEGNVLQEIDGTLEATRISAP